MESSVFYRYTGSSQSHTGGATGKKGGWCFLYIHDDGNPAEYAGGFSRPDRGAAERHPEPDQSGVRQRLC